MRIRCILGMLAILLSVSISQVTAGENTDRDQSHNDYTFEFTDSLRYKYYPDLKNRVWKDNTVKWWYNPSSQIFTTEETIQAIQAAAAAWESVCGIKFVYMGTTDQALSNKGDDKFVIGWIDENTFKNRFGTSSAAHTHVWWNSSYIYDGEMSINIDLWTTKYIYSDFQGIMTHELGHAIGLDHSDISGSIMYVPYHSTKYQMTLREDDINAARALYPITYPNNCFHINDNLGIMVSCVKYKDAKYKFTLNYASDLYWKMNLNTFATSEVENCLSVDDDLKLNMYCVEYRGNNYSFTLNYSPQSADPFGFYWKMDFNTFKRSDSMDDLVNDVIRAFLEGNPDLRMERVSKQVLDDGQNYNCRSDYWKWYYNLYYFENVTFKINSTSYQNENGKQLAKCNTTMTYTRHNKQKPEVIYQYSSTNDATYIFEEGKWKGYGNQKEYPGISASTVTCVNVDTTKWEPIGVKGVFTSADDRVTVFVKFEDIHDGSSLNLKWYKPDGTLRGENKNTVKFDVSAPSCANITYNYYGYYFIKGYENYWQSNIGKWRVDVYAEGKMVGQVFFEYK